MHGPQATVKQRARYESFVGVDGELDLRPALNVTVVNGVVYFLRPSAMLAPSLLGGAADSDIDASGARLRARAKLCETCAASLAAGRAPPSSYAAGVAHLIDMDYILRHGPCPEAPKISYLEQLVLAPVRVLGGIVRIFTGARKGSAIGHFITFQQPDVVQLLTAALTGAALLQLRWRQPRGSKLAPL